MLNWDACLSLLIFGVNWPSMFYRLNCNCYYILREMWWCLTLAKIHLGWSNKWNNNQLSHRWCFPQVPDIRLLRFGHLQHLCIKGFNILIRSTLTGQWTVIISMNNRNGLGMSYHLVGIFESVAPCNPVRLAQLCTIMHTCIVSGACGVVRVCVWKLKVTHCIHMCFTRTSKSYLHLRMVINFF